jgi:hypothetical protein
MDETPQPGCFLALVSLAEPMGADVVTPMGHGPALHAARYVLDFLLDNLASAGEHAAGLEIGVYGYRAAPEGLAFEWLLTSPEPEGALASFATLAQSEPPARAEGHPKKWVRNIEAAGPPATAEALARAHRVLAWWAAKNSAGRPPVFVHCATADGTGSTSAMVLRSIRALSVPAGSARVLEWTFEPGQDAGFPSGDLWDMLFGPTEPRPKPVPPSAPAFTTERTFWSQKRGNEPAMWEDAYAIGECGTVAAICDGASDGIFCRDWASRLANRFVQDRPSLATRAEVAAWIAAARTDWQAAIDYPKLRWSQQGKVNETGGSATLVGVEFGEADADGERLWRATAFGDACLLHVRNGDMTAFPVAASDQFNSNPTLLRTKPGIAPAAAFGSGTCRPGDLFLLATDAVAGKLIADAEQGPVDWESYAALAPESWLAEFDELRDANKMVNDDCTLIVLRAAPVVPAERPATDNDSTQDGATLTALGERSHVDPS